MHWNKNPMINRGFHVQISLLTLKLNIEVGVNIGDIDAIVT
jgi:hypothetical protein